MPQTPAHLENPCQTPWKGPPAGVALHFGERGPKGQSAPTGGPKTDAMQSTGLGGLFLDLDSFFWTRVRSLAGSGLQGIGNRVL